MATTINAYSVGLTLDASSYVRGSVLARNETTALRREVNQARSPSERYAHSVDRLGRAFKAGAIDAKTYNRLLREQKQRLADADVATKKHENSILALGKRYLATAAIAHSATQSLRNFADADAIKTQMEVLTGSANTAASLYGQIREISASSPITFTGAADAVRTMLLFNVQQKDVINNLKMLGDITGGDTERMKSLALAFSQATAAGRLQGQDLRQMIDAGFNPLQVIAKQTGETLDQVRERMGVMGSGLDLMNKAFKDATGEGGRFNGMLERMGNTASGQMAKLQSSVEMLSVDVGEKLVPALSQMVGLFEDGSDRIGFILKPLGVFIDGISLLTAVGRDFQNGMLDLFSFDKNGDFFTLETSGLDATTKFLDEWDKRQEKIAGDGERTANAQKTITNELSQQVGLSSDLADKAGQISEALENARQAREQARNRLQDMLVDEQFRAASLRYGEEAADRLRIAFDAMDEKRQETILNRLKSGMGVDDVIAADPNRRLMRQLFRQQDINSSIERRRELETQIGEVSQKYQEKLLDYQRARAEEYDRMREKMRQEVSQGPGSGRAADVQRQMDQQKNAAMALRIKMPSNQELAEFRQKREKMTGTPDRKDQEQLRELQRLRSELTKLQREQHTELVAAIKSNGFQRIR